MVQGSIAMDSAAIARALMSPPLRLRGKRQHTGREEKRRVEKRKDRYLAMGVECTVRTRGLLEATLTHFLMRVRIRIQSGVNPAREKLKGRVVRVYYIVFGALSEADVSKFANSNRLVLHVTSPLSSFLHLPFSLFGALNG